MEAGEQMAAMSEKVGHMMDDMNTFMEESSNQDTTVAAGGGYSKKKRRKKVVGTTTCPTFARRPPILYPTDGCFVDQQTQKKWLTGNFTTLTEFCVLCLTI